MEEKKLNRRAFLRASAMMAVGVAAAACAQATPEVIEREVPVEKIVKETVVVEKQVPVEKVVKETVVVQKEVAVEKVVTATPVPQKYKEAPMLAELVKAGKLPPVEERLPEDPLVETVLDLWGYKGTIGQYGGAWRMQTRGAGDGALWMRVCSPTKLLIWEPDFAVGEVRPGLCSSYAISPDGRDFTFTLRKGIKWDDGEPFTTADIQWWFDHHFHHEVLDPTGDSLFRQGDELAELKVSDDWTFTISYALPNGFMLWDMCRPGGLHWIRPAHWMRKVHVDTAGTAELEAMIKAAGVETWDQLYGRHNDSYNLFEFKPGLLPWKMTVAMGEATQVVWERNPYFWMVDETGQQLPYIDKLVGNVFQSAETAALAAVAGEVDMQSRHIDNTDYAPMLAEGQAKGGYSLFEQCAVDGPTHYELCLSQTTPDEVKRELFLSKDFKLALSHAVDREDLWGLVFRGAVSFTGPKWNSPLQTEEEDDLWAEYARYDVDLANQLLDGLGLTQRDNGGFRLMKDGNRLSILMETADVYNDTAQVLELVAEYWKVVGVEGIVKVWDRPLFQEKRDENECELCRHGGVGRGADYTINLIVDSRMEAPVHWEADWGHLWYDWYRTGGEEGIEPPEAVKRTAELFDLVRTTASFSKQIELYKEILLIRTREMFWINLGPYWVESCSFGVVNNNMKNVPTRMPNSWWWATPGPSKTWMYYYES